MRARSIIHEGFANNLAYLSFPQQQKCVVRICVRTQLMGILRGIFAEWHRYRSSWRRSVLPNFTWTERSEGFLFETVQQGVRRRVEVRHVLKKYTACKHGALASISHNSLHGLVSKCCRRGSKDSRVSQTVPTICTSHADACSRSFACRVVRRCCARAIFLIRANSLLLQKRHALASACIFSASSRSPSRCIGRIGLSRSQLRQAGAIGATLPLAAWTACNRCVVQWRSIAYALRTADR